MDLPTVTTRAKDIASKVLAPSASKNDTEGRFSTEAVAAWDDT